MSSSIVEILRSANEEIEWLEKAWALALHYKDDHPREAVLAERIVKTIIERIQKKSKEVLQIYADADGRLDVEKQVLSGQRFLSEEHEQRIIHHTGYQVTFLTSTFDFRLREIDY